VLCDAASLPFAPESFDLVIEVEAFAHCRSASIDALWCEAAWSLRVGGILASIAFSTG